MKPKINIVKIGGNVINDEKELKSFLCDFAALEGNKILVHGGGKKATELSSSLGLKTRMIGGRRVTDKAGLEVVTMVYAGLLNKQIVADLQGLNCKAIGLSGADANLVQAHKRLVTEIDYGFAGDVDQVDGNILNHFIELGLSPIFCSITHDGNGQLLNTNADTIAAELGKELASSFEVDLIYCFEKQGVLMDLNDESSVIESMNMQVYKDLIERELIAEGMLPKLKNCFEALENGVNRVLLGKPEIIVNPNKKHTSIIL